ncbi:MAG: hypothetical protein QOH45_1133, partial [Pseudonocardiales bacterium]|nr:hypothetical protein [Pseudonocardiales bacterium]
TGTDGPDPDGLEPAGTKGAHA